MLYAEIDLFAGKNISQDNFQLKVNILRKESGGQRQLTVNGDQQTDENRSLYKFCNIDPKTKR